MIAEFTMLVGLIATFKQLRDGRESDLKTDLQAEFIEFLISHNFEKLSKEIASSDARLSQIGELLQSNTEDILAKLETIEGAVLSVSQKIDGLKGLASTFPESEPLSNQAVSILQLMDKSKAGKGAFFDLEEKCGIFTSASGSGADYAF